VILDAILPKATFHNSVQQTGKLGERAGTSGPTLASVSTRAISSTTTLSTGSGGRLSTCTFLAVLGTSTSRATIANGQSLLAGTGAIFSGSLGFAVARRATRAFLFAFACITVLGTSTSSRAVTNRQSLLGGTGAIFAVLGARAQVAAVAFLGFARTIFSILGARASTGTVANGFA